MSKYTKITLRLLTAMAIVGSLGACADRNAKEPQDALTMSVNASSVDGDLRAGEISKLRVISSVQNYNEELSVRSDKVHFTLPSNEKQTLFFVAGERVHYGLQSLIRKSLIPKITSVPMGKQSQSYMLAPYPLVTG